MDALPLYQYDKLGTYYHSAFGDQKALSVIAEFQKGLDLVERQIDERNRHGTFPYEFLKSSKILNGTSI